MGESPTKRRREDELYAEAVAQLKAEKQLDAKVDRVQPIREAPTFYPTAAEFEDPLAYIESIRPEAEPFGICKIVPPTNWCTTCEVDWESERTFGTKKQRIDLLQESRPFDDGGGYTLKGYRAMADKCLKNWLSPPSDKQEEVVPPEEDANMSTSSPVERPASYYEKLEADYWAIVDGENEREVTADYGNDLDVAAYWSGFPRLSDPAEIAKLSREYAREVEPGSREHVARSGWNLNNIASWPGSVLRHFQVPVPGVNSPWLYMGMLFATFSWHNEDNYLYSINYNHLGSPKQWYGVPGSQATAFENVIRRVYKQRLQEIPDLLHHMNTMFNPAKIRALEVPVFKIRQDPGQFVVTFPQAFHSGFSYGWNCGEAVNFATAPWIEHAKQANERYRRLGRLAVLGHDRLIFTLARYLEELDLPAAGALEAELSRVISEDLTLRSRLYSAGLRDVSTLIDAPKNKVEVIDAEACDYDDKRVCAVCRHTCFLSAVACNCSQEAVSCLRHVHYLCQCPPNNKYLIEWESKAHLEEVLKAVQARCQELHKEAGTGSAPSDHQMMSAE